MSKYGNRKTKVYGIVFDSAAEAQRYLVLRDMEDSGEISDLVLQPTFEILPQFSNRGQHFKAVKYIADFQYVKAGVIVVEDVKGVSTAVFRLKAKMFRHRYPEIDFRVIKV